MKRTILIIIFLLSMSAPSSESGYKGVYSFMPDIAIDKSIMHITPRFKKEKGWNK